MQRGRESPMRSEKSRECVALEAFAACVQLQGGQGCLNSQRQRPCNNNGGHAVLAIQAHRRPCASSAHREVLQRHKVIFWSRWRWAGKGQKTAALATEGGKVLSACSSATRLDGICKLLQASLHQRASNSSKGVAIRRRPCRRPPALAGPCLFTHGPDQLGCPQQTIDLMRHTMRSCGAQSAITRPT